MKNIGKL